MTDLERIEDYLEEYCTDDKVLLSLQTLKEELAQQPTNSKNMPYCDECGSEPSRHLCERCYNSVSCV